MHLVLGLGNPGRRYAQTRHNAGFLVVDRLARRAGVPCTRKQFGALVDTVGTGSQRAVLAKPQTFMNRSGQAAASLRGYYKVDMADIVVVHDDVDLQFGDIRLKRGGGHGGHNGLRDLQQKLGDNAFVRVRFGVSRPPTGWDTADYVLAAWSPSETEQLDDLVDRAADAVDAVLAEGVKLAMNKVNARQKAPGAARAQADAGPTGPNNLRASSRASDRRAPDPDGPA